MSLTLDGTLGLNSINIGANIPGTGAFTTLSASSTVSGTGFSTYLLSPPAIGTTAPAAGKFTDLTSTGNTTIGNASTDTFTVYPQTISLINSTAITAASTKTLTLNGGAGSNGLVIDASNNVGIGTTPGAKLDVAGSIRMPYGSGLNTLTSGGSGITMLYNTTWNSVGNIVVLQNPYSDIVFANATTGTATEKMRLDSSGNLGLGVTPGSIGSGHTTFSILAQGNGLLGAPDSIHLIENCYWNGSAWVRVDATATSYLQLQNGNFKFFNGVGGTAGGAFTPNQAMTLDATGNLLVGNTAFANVSKMLAYATSAFNNNTYNPLELGSASGAAVNHQLQKTTVSTTATVILSTGLYASLVVIFGSDGTNRFIDLVLFGLGNGAVGVVSSFSVSGTPAARTYSQSSSTYRLAMASGTYTVQAYAMSMNG